jgi:peptidoglycan/LPS O-acetylase OafA/YrhL
LSIPRTSQADTLPLADARRHVPALDGLRGVAILLVLIHHFTPDGTGGSPLTVAFLNAVHTGWIGVDLFFVLSGFLITGILLDTRTAPGYFRNFIARRTLRIAPLYYGVLLFLFVALPLIAAFTRLDEMSAPLFGHQGKELAEISNEQGWLWFYGTNLKIAFDSVRWGAVNHFWSLAVEEHFYLVWPFVVYFCSPKWLARVCVLCIGAALALRIVLMAHGVDPLVCYVLTPCRIDALAMGGLLAMLMRSDAAAHLPRMAGTVSAGCTLLLLILVGSYGRFDREDALTSTVGYTLVAGLFAALVYASVMAPAGSWPNRVLTARWLMSFGKYSYGIYVLHHFFTKPLRELFPWSKLTHYLGSYMLAITAHLLIAIVISFAIGWLSYHLYEKHFLRLKRHFEYGKRVRTAPEAATLEPAPATTTAPARTVATA